MYKVFSFYWELGYFLKCPDISVFTVDFIREIGIKYSVNDVIELMHRNKEIQFYGNLEKTGDGVYWAGDESGSFRLSNGLFLNFLLDRKNKQVLFYEIGFSGNDVLIHWDFNAAIQSKLLLG